MPAARVRQIVLQTERLSKQIVNLCTRMVSSRGGFKISSASLAWRYCFHYQHSHLSFLWGRNASCLRYSKSNHLSFSRAAKAIFNKARTTWENAICWVYCKQKGGWEVFTPVALVFGVSVSDNALFMQLSVCRLQMNCFKTLGFSTIECKRCFNNRLN